MRKKKEKEKEKKKKKKKKKREREREREPVTLVHVNNAPVGYSLNIHGAYNIVRTWHRAMEGSSHMQQQQQSYELADKIIICFPFLWFLVSWKKKKKSAFFFWDGGQKRGLLYASYKYPPRGCTHHLSVNQTVQWAFIYIRITSRNNSRLFLF